MGDYNAPRKGNAYNYGGSQWKLSRSKIAAFMKCPKCFWIDNVGGIKHPGGFPFKLNEAVDLILKRESDHIRTAGDNHEPTSLDPMLESLGMKPYVHASVACVAREL